MVWEKILCLVVGIILILHADGKDVRENINERNAVDVNLADELKRYADDGLGNLLTRKVKELKDRDIISGKAKKSGRSEDYIKRRRQMYSDYWDDAGRGMYEDYWDI